MEFHMKPPRALDYFEEVYSDVGVWTQSASSVVVAVFEMLQEEAKERRDGRGFCDNLDWLLHAYATGHFYMMDATTTFPDELRVSFRIPGDRIPAFLAWNPKDPKKTIIWVHPKFRRLGCGRHLVEWMQDALPKAAKRVWVVDEAIPFWTKMGYELTGESDGPGSIEMQMTHKRRAEDDLSDDAPAHKKARREEAPTQRKWYLSIDIEGRGSSLSNPITAIGVFFAPTDDPSMALKQRWALQPLPGQVDEARCVREFWSRFPQVDEWIRKNARPAADVMAEFQEWCRAAVATAGTPGNITLVSDCPDYDIGRLDHLGHITGTWNNTIRYLGGTTRHSLVDPSERFEQLVPGAARYYEGWAYERGGRTRRLLEPTHFPDDDAEQIYYLQLFCDEHLR